MEEPALHRKTFAELGQEDRIAFLSQLRARRETIEKKRRQVREERDSLNHGSRVRTFLEKELVKIDKLWTKLEPQLDKLELLISGVINS